MAIFTIEGAPITTELTERADAGFRKHGFEATGFDEPIIRIAFVAYDNGTFAGCVTAHVLWRTLHIRHMFIEAPYRGMGLGTMLMDRALKSGKAHGCPIAFVDTLSFQAIGFYQKLGFVHEYTRTGFAHGISHHYLKKDPL